MAEEGYKKLAGERAALVCQDIDMDPAALALLSSDMLPAEYLQQLIANSRWIDAIRFLARALPKREAAWWACLCARSVITPTALPEHIKALEAAEAWVYRPTEENRRQTDAAARAAKFDNPASWAAMAAFWSGGSVTPPDVPVVPPADNLTAKAVAGAVMLAAVQSELEKVAEKYARFLEQGIDIARGGNGRLSKGEGSHG